MFVQFVKMATTTDKHSCCRKILTTSVGLLCKEQGYISASSAALETLTEFIQSYLTEIASCAQEYSQICQRTSPDLSDVRMALIDLGADIDNLHRYGLRAQQEKGHDLPQAKPAPALKPLSSSLIKQARPTYVPPYLPAFPDVYSYIKTPALRRPPNEYQMVRERYASQKKQTESALTKFMARTNTARVLIFENMNLDIYPLIDHVPSSAPYVKALLPSDNDVASLLPEASEKSTDDTVNEERPSDNQDVSLESTDNAFFRSPKKMKLSSK